MTIKAIQQTCPVCGLTRAYDHEIGFTREDILRRNGWTWLTRRWRWICPACEGKRKPFNDDGRERK